MCLENFTTQGEVRMRALYPFSHASVYKKYTKKFLAQTQMCSI